MSTPLDGMACYDEPEHEPETNTPIACDIPEDCCGLECPHREPHSKDECYEMEATKRCMYPDSHCEEL